MGIFAYLGQGGRQFHKYSLFRNVFREVVSNVAKGAEESSHPIKTYLTYGGGLHPAQEEALEDYPKQHPIPNCHIHPIYLFRANMMPTVSNLAGGKYDTKITHLLLVSDGTRKCLAHRIVETIKYYTESPLLYTPIEPGARIMLLHQQEFEESIHSHFATSFAENGARYTAVAIPELIFENVSVLTPQIVSLLNSDEPSSHSYIFDSGFARLQSTDEINKRVHEQQVESMSQLLRNW